jgi:NAD(P)-dependent dehydrogenase (short-subunit alcohol dehydrogenase family)
MPSKTVVITGGNRGIGLDITEMFLNSGYDVVVGSRTIGDLEKLGSDRLKFIAADVRSESSIKTLVSAAKRQNGSVDVFINNAGYSEWRPIEQIDESFLSDIISTNLMGAFWGCKAALSEMTAGGSIINISSIAGKRGSPNNSAYVATKFGLNGLTQALAKEVGSRGIRVNGVCPVLIATEGLEHALQSPHSPAAGDPGAFIQRFATEQAALKRLPKGQDVAAMCLFLASDSAAAITGQNINVDCGVFPQ